MNANKDEGISQMRAFAIERAAEAADLRLRVAQLEIENQRLKRRLNRIHRSWTWRAGRAVLLPYHLLVALKTKVRRRGEDPK
mgnify:CR=1 FL=1